MNYCLFKLAFSTPVHFGSSESARSLDTSQMSFCADTLFSAICHQAALVGNRGGDAENALQELYDMAATGTLLLSDSFPYKDASCYLPKPYLRPFHHRDCMSSNNPGFDSELNSALNCASGSETGSESDSSHENGKLMKKLRYIPIHLFQQYIDAVSHGKLFPLELIDHDFGQNYIAGKVSLLSPEKPEPYSVGLFSFYKNCGLHFIIGYQNDTVLTKFCQLMKSLEFGGLGGKTSSGYGKFHIDQIIPLSASESDSQYRELYRLLIKDNSAMTLTTSLPNNEELDTAMQDCAYSLVRRGGFIQSAFFDSPVKKHTQYFFAAGSVFQNRFCGSIYNVASNGPHPVYRYAKPLFVGVSL